MERDLLVNVAVEIRK